MILSLPNFEFMQSIIPWSNEALQIMKGMEELPQVEYDHEKLSGVRFGYLAINYNNQPVFGDFVGDLDQVYPEKATIVPFKRDIRMMNAFEALNRVFYSTKPYQAMRTGDKNPCAVSMCFGLYKLSVSGWGDLEAQLLLLYIADRANFVPKTELLSFNQDNDNKFVTEFCSLAGILVNQSVKTA